MVEELPDLPELKPAKSTVSDVGSKEPSFPVLRAVPHETRAPESLSSSSTSQPLPRVKDPMTQRWSLLSESTLHSHNEFPVIEPSQSSVQRWLIDPEDETHPVSCGNVLAAILDCSVSTGRIIW